MLNRRTALAGMAGLTAAAARPAGAAASASTVAHGVLADNPLALAFETAPSQLPAVWLAGRNGLFGVRSLLGRTLIIPLWAEWCDACMGELPDFARLQRKCGNDKFAIVPILTGPKKQMTPGVIAKLFEFVHAEIFEPLMENNWGFRLLDNMAGRGWSMVLPCNLLIAPDGRVVARQFGMPRRDETAQGSDFSKRETHLSPTEGQALVSRAEGGATLSLWGEAPGEEFAQAMANGFLG